MWEVARKMTGLKVKLRQPDHLYYIFLKFGAVGIPKSIIDTKIDKKNIRDESGNLSLNVPMPSKEVSLYLDRLITSIPFGEEFL